MNLQNLTKKEIELIKTTFTYGVTLGQKGMTTHKALEELNKIFIQDEPDLSESHGIAPDGDFSKPY